VLYLPLREVLLGRPAGREDVHQRVARRAHRPAGALSALPARPAETRGDDDHVGVRQVDPLVADPGDDERVALAVPELREEFLAARVARLPAQERDVQRRRERVAVVEVLDEDERLRAAVSRQQVAYLAQFRGVRRRDLAAVVAFRAGVFRLALVGVPRHVADLHLRFPDEAGLEQRVPVGADGRPDEREDVLLAVVFANGRGGESEAVLRLEFGAAAVHRRRHVMHLVVDDEAPPALVEQLAVPVHARGLVRGDGDGADLLFPAVVLADQVGGERGAGEQFVSPLAGEFAAGDEDQRLAADRGQHAHRGDGLSAAGRPDEHARLHVGELADPLALVVAQVDVQFRVEVVALVQIAFVLHGVARLVEDPLDLGDAVLGDPGEVVLDGCAQLAVVEFLAGDVAHQLVRRGVEDGVALLVGPERELVGALPLVLDPRLDVGRGLGQDLPDGSKQVVERVVRGLPDVLPAELVDVTAGTVGVGQAGELR